jgi:hypothetical protein
MRVERFIALGGGVTQESVETRPGPRISQPAFPRFVILTSQEEAGKVGQLGLFVGRQSLANSDDFLCGAAHVNLITANRRKLKRVRSGFSKTDEF